MPVLRGGSKGKGIFAPGSGAFQILCKCGVSSAIYPSVASTEKAWNRRYEPPNEPLTLEELNGMVEEPVWIEAPDMPNLHGWAINYGLDPDVMHIQYAEIGLDVYGKTWLAYRRRPGRG